VYPVRNQTYVKAARAATALADAGLKLEALSTMSEAINVSSTEADLRGLRLFIVPSIRRIEPDAVLQKLAPHVVRVRARSDLMNEWSKSLYGISDTSEVERAMVFDLTPVKTPEEIFIAAQEDLSRGRMEALTALLDAALATATPMATLAGVVAAVEGTLKRRKLPRIPKNVIDTIGETVADFASGGAYQAARSSAVMFAALTSLAIPGLSLFTSAIGVLRRFLRASENQAVDSPAKTLYDLGYLAHSSELSRLMAPADDRLLPAWLAEESLSRLLNERMLAVDHVTVALPSTTGALPFDEILWTVAEDLLDRGVTKRARAENSWRAASAEISEREAQRTVPAGRRELREMIEAESFEMVEREFAMERRKSLEMGERTSLELGVRRSLEMGKRDLLSTTEQRRVNVWLEDTPLPLVVGVDSLLFVNIGGPRNALLSTRFEEPEWGERQSIDVVLILTCAKASATPQTHRVVLSRTGDTDPVTFSIHPFEEGDLAFHLTIVTERDWDVLERVSFTLAAISVPEVVPA
jgi:hypothetical protein